MIYMFKLLKHHFLQIMGCDTCNWINYGPKLTYCWSCSHKGYSSKEDEFLFRNRIEGVNIEDLEYGIELESEFESGEDSWTDSENESFSSFESDDESEVSSENIEI